MINNKCIYNINGKWRLKRKAQKRKIKSKEVVIERKRIDIIYKDQSLIS